MWYSTTIDDRPIKINTEYIAIMYPDINVVVLSSGNELTLPPEIYADLDATMFPTRKKVAKDDTQLADFLNTLHRLTGGTSAAILTPQRKKKLEELLKTMSQQQLMTAASNIGNDKFLQGENDRHKRYGDVDYLLRPDKAAKWAEQKSEDKRRKMF